MPDRLTDLPGLTEEERVIAERAEKATPGPWETYFWGKEVFGEVWSRCSTPRACEGQAVARVWSPDQPADGYEEYSVKKERAERKATAEFIAASRIDVPELLRKVSEQSVTLSASREREKASESDRLAGLFDRHGVECGNCGARLIAQGGTLGEHHGLTVMDGDEEPLCGYCAGMELVDVRGQLAAAERREQNWHDRATELNDKFVAEELKAEALRRLAESQATELATMRAQIAGMKREWRMVYPNGGDRGICSEQSARTDASRFTGSHVESRPVGEWAEAEKEPKA